MANLKFTAAVLFVNDIKQSIHFYTEILGCTIEQDFGTNVTLTGGIGLWEISEGQIIDTKGANRSGTSNRMELYFETENIQALFENLEANKVEFLHNIHEEPWGQKTIRFFDIDKHLIEIGESLHTFVTRMHKEGLSTESLSNKTGIPIDFVKELLEIE